MDCGGQVWSQDDGGAGAQRLPPLLTDDSTAGERGATNGGFRGEEEDIEGGSHLSTS